MEYKYFDIHISAERDGEYSVRAESESFGEQAGETFSPPDKSTIEKTNDRLARRQTDVNFLESTGRDLHERLFAEKIKTLFLLSLGEVRNDPDRGLRLRLRIAAPELAALPWELLYSDIDDAYIGTRVQTPLVRYLDMPGYRRELATSFPFRILVVIPRGSDPARRLDADSEKAVIENAVADLGDKVEVTYLHEQHEDRRVTLRRISDQLSEQHYHCFHFVGHGTFKDHRGYLVLDGDDGNDAIVNDERFAELFVNAPTIKLVILNACKGAALSSSQPLAGCAARLVKRGVPAVVAMQFSIYDTAAVEFAQRFYHSLFKSNNAGRVDVAISSGRHELAANYRDQRELAAPVLFMHAASGILFVPETGNLLADLPKNKEQLDTLQAAHESTSSEAEAARFKRRISIARRSVQIGLTVGVLFFFLSAIRILDIFTIDTQAEFLVMAFGNGLAQHTVSDDLRIVTVAGEGLDPAGLRSRIGSTVDDLSRAGARVVALDMFYSSDNGLFKTAPESGQQLVAEFERAATPVVIGAESLAGGNLGAPDALRAAVAGIGYLCFESKLGLTRSLPIAARVSGNQYPSFALAAFAAFEGGQVLNEKSEQVAEPIVVFPDKPSVTFAVSEINDVNRRTTSCELIKDGDQIAHRFIRLTPDNQLAHITTTAAELRDAMENNPVTMRQRFNGKLVLVGVLGRGDIIADLAGNRDGVLWQADAINNLLLDEVIIPLRDSMQFVLMMLLALFTAAARLQFRLRKRISVLFLIAVTAAVPVFAVFTYGRLGVLINPAYYLLAVWLAWWLTGRFGRTWFR